MRGLIRNARDFLGASSMKNAQELLTRNALERDRNPPSGFAPGVMRSSPRPGSIFNDVNNVHNPTSKKIIVDLNMESKEINNKIQQKYK